MAQRTLIKGGTVISVDPAVGDFETRRRPRSRTARSPRSAPSLEAGDAEVIDATDRIVLPGLIDTHRHTWQALFRNIASDWTLAHYFTGLHGTMSQLYRPEDTYAGNLIGTLEALDGGITTLLDWSHNLNTPEHSDAAHRGAPGDGLARRSSPTAAASRTGRRSSSLPHDEDIRRVARAVLLLRRPARHAGHGAARQPVRDARGDRARLPARATSSASASPATPATASGARGGRSRSSRSAACSARRRPTCTATRSPTTS